MRTGTTVLVILLAALPVQAQDKTRLETAAAEITQMIQSFPAKVYLDAKNIDTGAEWGYRADEKVRTASTIKLPILAALFDLAAKGKADWGELVELHDADKISGSGVLTEFSDGVKLPLRDVAHLMIVVSDNTATNLILDRITADSVNAFMDTLGLPKTRALRKVRGDGTELRAAEGWSKAGLLEENKKYGLGVSTPREMVTLLEKIERGEVVSPAASREMIAILKRQQYKDGIGRRLEGVEVASKSGALDALRSDVGITYTPGGRIAMAITVDGLAKVDYSEDNPALPLIAEIAKKLVGGLAR
jgi:beta-lactamase class A